MGRFLIYCAGGDICGVGSIADIAEDRCKVTYVGIPKNAYCMKGIHYKKDANRIKAGFIEQGYKTKVKMYFVGGQRWYAVWYWAK